MTKVIGFLAKKIMKPKPKKSIPRNPYVLAALFRKGGFMRDRRAPRAGSKNLQQEYLEQAEDLDIDISDYIIDDFDWTQLPDYIESLHIDDFDWTQLPDYIVDGLTEEEFEED